MLCDILLSIIQCHPLTLQVFTKTCTEHNHPALSPTMKFTERITRISNAGREHRYQRRAREDASDPADPAYPSPDEDVSAESRRRRAEALRACGLLDHSWKYGNVDMHHRDDGFGDRRSNSVRSDSSSSDERTLFGDVRYLLFPISCPDIQNFFLSFLPIRRDHDRATRRSVLARDLGRRRPCQRVSSAHLGRIRSRPESE